MKGQRLRIEKINSTSEEAKVTGVETTTKFKVASCVECMWFDEDNKQLKIRWIGMSETEDPEDIGVSVAWNGIGISYETCLVGGSSCMVTIDETKVDAAC